MKALVLGDAAGVRVDARAAFALFTPDAIFAVNNIGIAWEGQVDVWCTLHPSPCNDWIGMEAAVERRLKRGHNLPELWGHKCRAGIENKTNDWGGSTGLLAVKVALEKGFTHIVLAGVPMSPEGAHYYSPRKNWTSAKSFRRAWQIRAKMLAPRVKSMSGWTRELLGAPTAEWLHTSSE